ncbi:RNI-like protein [Aaosphaeria arxii CBS 175.79]|uniref:RNI-like protein n=1 Tax=Aaosphaeria arxii CBS 175.79 TaxID=1450172 RepID=A0A6A5XWL7_9PLEO|nr:RNI-like protein [Aaosphaeria arxii CBS 175.79]KAF2017552.1 RNI-like protein [Aaosphaeria arxii CBS 175.79]
MSRHTISPDEYLELGRNYYKQKNYEKAIEAFTHGIEASETPLITLLDYRAASYIKNENSNAALKDARDMIRMHKKDIRGYLRTASLLEKTEKFDTALNIYAYGKKNVPTTDKNYKLLQQLHDKLTRKISPPTSVDPFTILPPELIDMVLDYLGFRNMVRCLPVSKGWKTYICGRPSLWTNLDLSLARKDVSRAFVRDAVKRSRGAITHATFHRFYHTDMLKRIPPACKQLGHLEFLSGRSMSDTFIEMAKGAPNLKKLVVHVEVTLDTITQVLRHRPTLEHVEFLNLGHSTVPANWTGPFPDLKSISLHPGDQATRFALLNLPAFLAKAPSLRTLSLTNWAGPIDRRFDPSTATLTHLNLTNLGLESIPPLPPTLTHLTLTPRRRICFSNTRPYTLNAQSWLNITLASLPNLTHLSLSRIILDGIDFFSLFLDMYEPEDDDNNGMAPQLTSIPDTAPLQHLSLREIEYPEPYTLFGPTGYLSQSKRILTPSLESLKITNTPITDNDIDDLLLSAPYPNLHTVDLSVTHITGASVKTLVDNLPALRDIVLNDCPNIVDREAVDYALGRGIGVMRVSRVGAGSGRKLALGSRSVRHG